MPAIRRPLAGAGLALALAAVVVLVADASQWFSLLPRWAVAAIGALSAVWLIALVIDRWVSRRAWEGRLPFSLALALIALPLLCANALARAVRLDDLPARAEKLATHEIERRADRLEAEFHSLLSLLAGPLEAARGGLAGIGGSPARAFALIDRIDAATGYTREGRGTAVYGASGEALAWAGGSYPATAGLVDGLPPDAIIYRAVVEDHLTRLYGLLSSGDHVAVSEITVASRLDPRMSDRSLPVLAGDDAVAPTLQDFREKEGGFAGLLDRHGDRYPGGAVGERKLLFVGLRAPDGTFLGYAGLRGSGPSDLRRRIDRGHRDAAALILALFVTGLCLLSFYPVKDDGEREADSGAAILLRMAAGATLIWGGRVMLSWFPLEIRLGDMNLFDSSLFASAGFFHLLRSPGDLLMTAMVCLATALLVIRGCGRLADRWDASVPSARICVAVGWILLIVIVSGAAALLPDLAREFVNNSAENLLLVEPFSSSAASLVLQIGALLILLSLFLLAQAAIQLTGAGGGILSPLARLSPRPGDGLSRWTFAAFLPGIVFAALLYDPLVLPRTEETIESIFENSLLPAVTNQREARRAILRATVDSLESIPDLPDKVATGAERTRDSLALDVWLKTPLKDSGYYASLRIVDPNGVTISRFARNLPPIFDRRAPETELAPPGEPTLEEAAFLNLRKKIWHADHEVVLGDLLVATVTVHMIEDFENLPFLSAEKPYARALNPHVRPIMALPPPSRRIRHAVYDRSGEPIFLSQREAPHLPDDWKNLLTAATATRWIDLVEEGRPSRYLFFSDGNHIFALGFARGTPMERIARGIRMVLLSLMVLCALLLPAALIQAHGRLRGWWPRLLAAFGRTHYRRLLTTFTAATLIPLLVLSILMSGYITSEIEEDIEARGRQGIQSAGFQLRTILELEGDERVKPDEDTLYWLSLFVGEDVNLYQRGELVATSRPELFSSGLLSARMDGQTYRALTLQARRFAMGRQTLRGDEFRTITATLEASEGEWEGYLSLPLDAQTAEAIQAAREVADTMTITIVGMVLLMGGVAYLLARRVSHPIRSLSAAAARIAGGDLDAVVEVRPRDETGDLIASFNQMARALKEQREDLERRKDYIEKILQNATIGVISMDSSGRVVTANPAAGTILDLPRLAEGASLVEMVSHRPALAPLARTLKDPTGSPSRDVELTLPGAPSGKTVRARAVPFLEGRGVILLLEDVTETVRSNRLAAWAEMARRIAHEIKNPLTPIQLSAEHIRRVHAEASPRFPQVLEECLRTIMYEVANLRQISAEFSTYARIPTPQKESTAMSSLIEDVVRPYRAATPLGIDLEIEIPHDLPRIEVDRSLISRAMVNLIENALQAMPRGGVLAIRARADRAFVTIEVADSGVGMDAVALARIFEPYFSTKDMGTGLGLAIARKAIEEHAGRIEVASAPGAGTRMRVLLPIVAGASPGASEGDEFSSRQEEKTAGPASSAGRRRE